MHPCPPVPAHLKPARVLAATRCVALAAMMVGAVLFGFTESRAQAAGGKVNVNAASAAELAQVPGIDSNIAVRIVARRTSKGPFHTLDELLEVPGVTKLTMVQAAERLEIGASPAPATATVGSAASNGGRKLDLNKATFPELLLLPEMTPRAAKSIVDYREKNHGFGSVDELDHVAGLDKRLLIKLLDQVTVGAPRAGGTALAAATPNAGTPGATPGGSDTATLGENGWNGSWVSKLDPTPQPSETNTPKEALAPGEKIDLNTAERADLERLPEIGPVMSQRILEYRKTNGPFKDVDALLQVRGLGAQKLASIRQYVMAGGSARPVKTPVAVAAATRTPKPHPGSTAAVAATARPAETPRATPEPTRIARVEKGHPDSMKAVLPDGRVNINVAGIDDLLTLPRMTRDAANEIVNFRQKNGPFHDPHSITDVPSIGEATYARIREKITIGE